LIKIIKMRELTKDILKISEQFPFLVNGIGQIESGISHLALLISRIGGCAEILFGRNVEENTKHEDFSKQIDSNFNISKDGLTLFQFLNEHLSTNTFCNGFQITVSDLYAYAHVIINLNLLNSQDKWSYCNLVRWIDHIQNLKGIKELIRNLKLKLNLPYDPLILEEPVVEKFHKKEKKEDKRQQHCGGMVIEDESQNSDVKTEKPIQENKKKVKQVQDQKTDKTKNLPVKAAEASDDIHPISKLDIRVGYVKSVVLNTQADKLYNQEIDIGGGEIRKKLQVV